MIRFEALPPREHRLINNLVAIFVGRELDSGGIDGLLYVEPPFVPGDELLQHVALDGQEINHVMSNGDATVLRIVTDGQHTRSQAESELNPSDEDLVRAVSDDLVRMLGGLSTPELLEQFYITE